MPTNVVEENFTGLISFEHQPGGFFSSPSIVLFIEVEQTIETYTCDDLTHRNQKIWRKADLSDFRKYPSLPYVINTKTFNYQASTLNYKGKS
jgi:hypothetical protein